MARGSPLGPSAVEFKSSDVWLYTRLDGDRSATAEEVSTLMWAVRHFRAASLLLNPILNPILH